MKITSYGHSCYGIDLKNHRILFDPFISGNSLASHIQLKEINTDYILISHGHQDHISDAPRLLRQTNAQLIANFEISNWFQKQGFQKITAMNTGGTIELEGGEKVKMVPALHSSSLPDGTYGGNPSGFVIESKEKNFYFSGDTSLCTDLKILIELGIKLDFGIICIGDVFTMGIKEAIICAKWLGLKKVIGCHYDTFPPIAIDKKEAIESFTQEGIDLLLPQAGENLEI